MSIDARLLDDPDRWNDLLDDAEHATAFHRAEALDVLADAANAECHRLVGYKGQEPVGLFPVFTISKGPVTAAFSPPPNLKIHYLGPTLMGHQSPKRRRREKQHRRFVEACLDWLDDAHAPKFTQIRTVPGYSDVRPFTWQDFEAVPRYTYVVDLTRGADDLLAAFSSDARKNITGDYDVSYTIEEAGTEGIEHVIEQVAARHDAQDEPFPVTASFVTDLYEALPDGMVRATVCRIDGEFVGGNVNVEHNGRAFNWLGGAKTDADLPVNDLVDWRFTENAIERGVHSHDLAGANNQRIAPYKAKFAPDLVPYYRLQASSPTMGVAARLYDALQ